MYPGAYDFTLCSASEVPKTGVSNHFNSGNSNIFKQVAC